MRVALCISGEMRTYKQNHKALMANLILPYNCDVFISTWNTSSFVNSKGESIKIPITKDELDDMYNPVSIKLYDFDDSFFYEYNGVVLPKILIEKKPNAFRANIPQHFLMNDCNGLKSKYEDENNFKYDVVIRHRPDLLVFKKINLNKIDLNKINLKHIIKDTWYCDQFALGSSELMDKYTSVFQNLNEYWKDPLQDGQFKNILNGETLMRHHILKNELPHTQLRVRYPIIRFNDSFLIILKKIYLINFKNMLKIALINLRILNPKR